MQPSKNVKLLGEKMSLDRERVSLLHEKYNNSHHLFQIDVTCKDVESIRVDKVCEAKKVERYCIFHQEKKS